MGMGDGRARQRGFTLGELLTAAAVVGVSLSLAVPSFTSAIGNNRRALAVNELVATLHRARSEAITRNTQITVCPSRAGSTCDGAHWNEGWIYFADPDHDRQVGPGEVVLGAGPALADFRIDSDEFTAFLAYRASGRALADAGGGNTGAFTFCHGPGGEAARLVLVDALGEPRLAERQADGRIPECHAD